MAYEITLNPTNLTRLAIARSFSLFQYEVMNDLEQADEIAENALQGALEMIDEIKDEDFGEFRNAIEILKENLVAMR